MRSDPESIMYFSTFFFFSTTVPLPTLYYLFVFSRILKDSVSSAPASPHQNFKATTAYDNFIPQQVSHLRRLPLHLSSSGSSSFPSCSWLIAVLSALFKLIYDLASRVHYCENVNRIMTLTFMQITVLWKVSFVLNIITFRATTFKLCSLNAVTKGWLYM